MPRSKITQHLGVGERRVGDDKLVGIDAAQHGIEVIEAPQHRLPLRRRLLRRLRIGRTLAFDKSHHAIAERRRPRQVRYHPLCRRPGPDDQAGARQNTAPPQEVTPERPNVAPGPGQRQAEYPEVDDEQPRRLGGAAQDKHPHGYREHHATADGNEQAGGLLGDGLQVLLWYSPEVAIAMRMVGMAMATKPGVRGQRVRYGRWGIARPKRRL